MFTSLMLYFRLVVAILGLGGLTFLYFHGMKKLMNRFTSVNTKQKNFKLIFLPLGLILGITTYLVVSSFYVYHGFNHQPDIYRHGNQDQPMVSITFDDGPSPIYTPQILEILKEYNVPATFFLIGSNAEKYPQVALEIVENGHEIGNHTQNHRNIPTLAGKDLNKEVIEGTASIIDAVNLYPEYFRPPRGMYDGRLRRLTALMGQQLVLWTISTQDWQRGITTRAIVKNATGHIKNGDIILFHDSGAFLGKEGGNRMATVQALPKVIEIIQEKGFQIVPLKTLLHDEPLEDELPMEKLKRIMEKYNVGN